MTTTITVATGTTAAGVAAPDLGQCQHRMQGRRGFDRRGDRDFSYIKRRPRWSRPSPNRAVAVVDGVPLCGPHAPAHTRRVG